MKPIENELGLKKWFEKNYKKLGYSKILRKDNGTFPDFIMERAGRIIRVELETDASHFILHGHDKDKVDEVVCIYKDLELDLPTREIDELKFIGRKKTITATVEKGTSKKIEKLIKEKKYRNKSHFIEDAINSLLEKGGKK